MAQSYMGITPAEAVRQGVPVDELIHLWKLTPAEIDQLRARPTPAQPDATRTTSTNRVPRPRSGTPIRKRRKTRNVT